MWPALIPIVGTLIEKFIPDPKQAADAKLKMLEMAQKGWPIVARNLDRVMQVTLNMLAFAKDRPLDPEPMLLDSVVDEACALAEAALRRRGGSLERTRAEGLAEVPIDLVAVHQTLLNLLMNAVDAAPEKAPRVAVSTHWIHPCPRWPSGAVATIVRELLVHGKPITVEALR